MNREANIEAIAVVYRHRQDTEEEDADAYHFLKFETTSSIRNQIYSALLTSDLGEDQSLQYLDSLQDNYRYIDEISELRKGAFTRWIGLDKKKLVNGGIVLDIDPGASGSMVVTCKNFSGRIFRYDFNNAVTFQKLTYTEKMILAFNSDDNLLEAALEHC